MDKIKGVRKIGVLRASALGDFIFSLPALNALKQSYPEAELVLFATKWHRDFVKERESPIDRVEIVPISKGVHEEEGKIEDSIELQRFFNSVKKEEFDIMVQMHGGGRNSNHFVLKMGSKLTLGSATSDARILDINVPYLPYQHEVFRLLELTSKVGAFTNDFVPEVKVTRNDIEEAKKVLGNINYEKIIVIHPGATDPGRRWPYNKFAEVADKLIQLGYEVVLTGVDYEKDIIDKMISSMKNHPINSCSKLSLNGLVGLLSMAKLLISNDTGPFHLGEALSIPTVGLIWCVNVPSWGPLTRSKQRPLISWLVNCPVCGENIADFYPIASSHSEHEVSLIDEIEIDEVMDASIELLTQEGANIDWTYGSRSW